MNAAEVTGYIGEVQVAGDTILKAIEAADPNVALPAGTAELVLDLIAQLAMKALTAWSQAAGVPITSSSILALLPNQTPLSAPDAAKTA